MDDVTYNPLDAELTLRLHRLFYRSRWRRFWDWVRRVNYTI